ncbi:hypothetical protein E2320_022788 [Naja naja]|nr:hypothetical protein E2320_022788 [Naja naja]
MDTSPPIPDPGGPPRRDFTTSTSEVGPPSFEWLLGRLGAWGQRRQRLLLALSCLPCVLVGLALGSDALFALTPLYHCGDPNSTKMPDNASCHGPHVVPGSFRQLGDPSGTDLFPPGLRCRGRFPGSPGRQCRATEYLPPRFGSRLPHRHPGSLRILSLRLHTGPVPVGNDAGCHATRPLHDSFGVVLSFATATGSHGGRPRPGGGTVPPPGSGMGLRQLAGSARGDVGRNGGLPAVWVSWLPFLQTGLNKVEEGMPEPLKEEKWPLSPRKEERVRRKINITPS